ncbi:unnamed protein product [Adineta steineri]|uniref:Protein kinase domain-containing protein n=3 Tax=Adineta steineri TaxID=433720 RepID=A0A819N9J8_9BILA|nr:unnamed protein product [Adineta steineri]
MAISSRYNLTNYRYDIDIKKKRQLYGMSGKIIFNGQWLSKQNKQIIIVEMNQTIAEREGIFYLEVNDHANIIHTLGYIEDKSNLTILIQEFAMFNDLAGLLMDNKFNFSQLILVEMFRQIADAMSYISSKKIVHGDLGCRNILVFRVDINNVKNNLVKITDFGLARWIDKALTNEDSSIIPIRYCAPEILRHNHHANYSERSDIYSMGVLIWEGLSNSEIPYSSIAKDDDVKRMKLNNIKLKKPLKCDDQLWNLMNDCWHSDPLQRPNFEQITNKLHKIQISEVSYPLITASSHKMPISYNYELNTHVRITDSLNNTFPRIHQAEWISQEERPIVIIERYEELSEYERLIHEKFKNHPHIIYTFGLVDNDHRSTMILQERAQYGNLQTLLNNGQFNPSPQVLIEIFRQIIDAMIDITNQGLVHGDLCCENILVFDMHSTDPARNRIKLNNFTMTRRNDPSIIDDRQIKIPVRYCAPEILRGAGRSNYSQYSDVYSMGVLMWQACSNGKLPYQSSVTNSEIRQRKLNGEKLSKPILCDTKIWSIIEDCWYNEPELRYEFKDMKTRLSCIDVSNMKSYQYELNVNVKPLDLLNDSYGRFYNAEWIPKNRSQIILYFMNEENAEREASFLMKFNSHPHIIHTFGFVKNNIQSIILLQEQAQYGNLQILLQQNSRFQPSIKVLVTIFLQIVNAMIYITNQHIVHGDLRCGNILVFEMNSKDSTKNLVKLTNFSLSRRQDETISQNRVCNSLIRYVAPEIVRSRNKLNSNELSDVYSMGVLMWQAFSKGAIPYGYEINDDNVQERRLNGERLERPKECNKEVWEIINDCLHNEPELRYNFKEIEIRLTNVQKKLVQHILCSQCDTDILEDELYNHQKSCAGKYIVDSPPTKPSVVIQCRYCGKECPEYQIRNHNKSCLASRQRPCTHCNRKYTLVGIERHEKACPYNPSSESYKPGPTQQQCKHCGQQYLLNQIDSHEKVCETPIRSQVDSKSVPSENCTHCGQKYSLTAMSAHEKSCSQRSTLMTKFLRFFKIRS